MRVIAKRTLRDFWSSKPEHADSEEPLSAWHAICRSAKWKSPAEVKKQFRSVSFVKNNAVFNVAGNKYRLVVRINYEFQIIYIKFVGTHKQYDKTDVGSL